MAISYRGWPIAARFWAQVRKTDGCWEWTALRATNGYGRFSIDGTHKPAHRIAWTLTNGPIPTGLYVCHHCDNKVCVRPEHLFLGTNSDNMRDREIKGRGNHIMGSRHHWAKLSEKDIPGIRWRAANGELQRKLAAEFGVAQPVISRLIRRATWKHVG